MISVGSAISAESSRHSIASNEKVATFAGGCFWCTESDFEKVPGVTRVISGYSGGDEVNPTYKQVSAGQTGHTEAVEIYYDPKVISYQGLLEALWRQINPTDARGQFVDRGQQYRPAIFYRNSEEKALAEASMAQLNQSGRYDQPLATELVAFNTFYQAEDYHQDYYKRNPIRYKFYRYNSGRDQYLEKIWGEDLNHDYTKYSPEKPAAMTADYVKPDAEVLRSSLSSLQYRVTQEKGTEPAFKNSYWDEKRQGIYVDIVSGEPLFSSLDKFDSGTGWPSFTRPIKGIDIVEKDDSSFFMRRVEVRSAFADSHLGHLFNDGPEPTGLRYCINSASMRFIPTEDLEEKGYAQFAELFR